MDKRNLRELKLEERILEALYKQPRGVHLTKSCLLTDLNKDGGPAVSISLLEQPLRALEEDGKINSIPSPDKIWVRKYRLPL